METVTGGAANWNVPRRASSVLLLVRLAGEFGASADAALHGTGLDEAGLLIPSATVMPAALGLTAGTRCRLTTDGARGLGIATSDTLREARARTFDALAWSFCSVEVVESGTDVLLPRLEEDPQRLVDARRRRRWSQLSRCPHTQNLRQTLGLVVATVGSSGGLR